MTISGMDSKPTMGSVRGIPSNVDFCPQLPSLKPNHCIALGGVGGGGEGGQARKLHILESWLSAVIEIAINSSTCAASMLEYIVDRTVKGA